MNKETFITELKKINIDASEENMRQLDEYYRLLIEWNNKINLTAITSEEEVYLKHFYDSLTLALVCDLTKAESLCDIGTGAGFPGIVLKIFYPNLKITLIDSLEKRIIFLNEVISKLHLKDIEALHVRAEEYAQHNRGQFDIVTSRAVAKLNVLTELSLPILKLNGVFIAMKANCDEEINNITNNLKILGGKLDQIKKFVLPIENINRTLIKIIKKTATPTKYPRNFEKIKKNPL